MFQTTRCRDTINLLIGLMIYNLLIWDLQGILLPGLGVERLDLASIVTWTGPYVIWNGGWLSQKLQLDTFLGIRLITILFSFNKKVGLSLPLIHIFLYFKQYGYCIRSLGILYRIHRILQLILTLL